MSCVFEEANFSINCTIAIADSQVIANVSVNSGETDIMTLRNAVVGCVRSVVDIIGYLHGISFDVEIVSVASRETNAVIVFGIGIPAVTELRKPESLGKLDASALTHSEDAGKRESFSKITSAVLVQTKGLA